MSSQVYVNPILVQILADQMKATIAGQKRLLSEITKTAQSAQSSMDSDASAQLAASVAELLKYTESHQKSIEKYAQFLDAVRQEYQETEQVVDSAVRCVS